MMNYNEWYNCTKDLMRIQGLKFNLDNFIKFLNNITGEKHQKPKTWFNAYLLMCD